LKVSLETGRRHQIRIQLAHMGHPILGDLRYGAVKPIPGRHIALLAHVLSVNHPVRGDRLVLTSPMPEGWPWPDVKKPAHGRSPWDWHVFAPVIH
jgi:23S rRNA pseudouridine1911/1915/1917 synthase